MNAKRLLANLAVVLLSGFIIVYIIIQLISNFSTDVEYVYASYATIDKTVEKDAYILRNETVLTSDVTGIVTYSVRESEKVSAKQKIAGIYESSEGVDLQNRIRLIDRKLEILERSAVDTSYLTSDVSKVDNKIYSTLIQMKTALKDRRVSLTSQYKETLLINFNKRQLITNSELTFEERVAALQSEKAALTSTLQTPLATIYAEKPGYFSTLLDGYETVFTIDVLNRLTVDSFHRLLEEKPASDYRSAIGKIVTDFDWYLLCEVSNNEAATYETGKWYNVGFMSSSREVLRGNLDRKVSQTDTDLVVLVFRMEEVPADFDYTRKQTIRISETDYSGLSIPKSALRIIDGVEGVFILSGNKVEFKKVEIVYSGDLQYICKSYLAADQQHRDYLALHDRVITSGKNLYVGKILN